MASNTDKSVLEQITQLQARVLAAEQELALWRNLQVAPESGGGGVQFGATSVVLRINSLTSSSAQMP